MQRGGGSCLFSLNTEVGILLHNPQLASQVEKNIERDMLPENSWDPATDHPGRFALLTKRNKLKGWKALPLQPVL